MSHSGITITSKHIDGEAAYPIDVASTRQQQFPVGKLNVKSYRTAKRQQWCSCSSFAGPIRASKRLAYGSRTAIEGDGPGREYVPPAIADCLGNISRY